MTLLADPALWLAVWIWLWIVNAGLCARVAEEKARNWGALVSRWPAGRPLALIAIAGMPMQGQREQWLEQQQEQER